MQRWHVCMLQYAITPGGDAKIVQIFISAKPFSEPVPSQCGCFMQMVLGLAWPPRTHGTM